MRTRRASGKCSIRKSRAEIPRGDEVVGLLVFAPELLSPLWTWEGGRAEGGGVADEGAVYNADGKEVVGEEHRLGFCGYVQQRQLRTSELGGDGLRQ